MNPTPHRIGEMPHPRGRVARWLFSWCRGVPSPAQVQLAAIVDSSDDAIIGKTLDGIITNWNRGAAKIFGYTAAETIGRSMSMLLPPDRTAEEPEILARIARGEPIEHFETVRLRKDGRRIDVSVTISPIRDADGRIVGASKIARDITELKRSEAEIRRLGRMYAALSEVNQCIVRVRSREELFAQICRALVESGGFKLAWIGWPEAATARVVPIAQFGDTTGYLENIQVYADQRPEGLGPVGTAIREARPCVFNDFRRNATAAPWREAARRADIGSAIALPVRFGGQVVAALAVYAAEEDFFGNREITLLLEATDDVTFALENLARETLRRQAEETLQRERDLFNSLISSIPDRIYFKDRASRFVRVNNAMADSFGQRSPDELQGKSDADFFSPEHAQQAYDDEQRVMRTDAPLVGYEEKETWLDGRITWVSTTKIPWRDAAGQIIGLIGVSRDITQRKRDEQRLTLLFTALQAAPNAIVITDARGTIEWVNPAFSAVTGYSAAEAIGQNPRLLKSGQQSPEVYAEMWRAITNGRSWHGEFVNRRKDGSLYTEDVTIAPVRDEAGHIGHFVAIKLDVTARREAEHHVREQAELLDRTTEAIVAGDLAGRLTFWNRGAERLLGWTAAEVIGRPVADVLALFAIKVDAEIYRAVSGASDWRGEVSGVNRRGEALVVECSLTMLHDGAGQANGRLCILTDITEKKKLSEQFLRAQRLESIGMLAAGIAHDLNNTLAPIGMASVLLRTRITESSDVRLLDTLERCADRGAGLVKQILGFARGVGGEPRLVQVKHLLRDAVDVVTQTFPKSITLEENIPSELWPVRANPTQIHQVLLNLCVNARDAMPSGGKLQLSAENCLLDEAAAARLTASQPESHARPGAWLVIHVVDSGTGIAPDVLQHIWEPFFTTKEVGKGTGLGLSTVRGIVADHFGFITLHTAPRQGTAVNIYLPAAETPADSEPSAAPSAHPRGRNQLILLVDDEETIRQTAAAILETQGYRVLTAADGLDAAREFELHADEITAMVTDLDMPNLDGLALIEIARTLRPAARIVAMSGLGSSRTCRGGDGDAPGADAFLAKPFAATALLEAVTQVLQGSSPHT